MKIGCALLMLILTGLAVPSSSRGDSDSIQLHAPRRMPRTAAIDSPDYRKYAPDRTVQMRHLALDVTPDFLARTVKGTAVLTLRVETTATREIKLDAVDLTVASVTATRPLQAWQSTDDKLVLTFNDSIAPGNEVEVTVAYSAEPKEGLYFRTPEMGYKDGDTHLFSQGEESEARHWYPCLDYPNQLCTTEITCHVPEGMTVIANGRLLAETHDAATHQAVFHWVQEKNHANYLVSLVAGYFKTIHDEVHGLPLAFHTLPSDSENAESSFRDTKDMIEYFEKEIGVPYAWAKYDQTCVNDFVAGGMENTSATTLTDSTLYPPETENLRNSEGLISHELAHQWFGDLVTCKDWGHVWLNESFATYYETLYNGHKNGHDAYLYELYQRIQSLVNINDDTAIVRRDYATTGDMFGYLSYPKGSMVVHMLRSELGEDLYRRCIKTYLERFQHKNVVSDDLREVIEELSGRSFDQFFDQWLYHGRQPELDIDYSWDESAKLAKVSIRQTQEITPKVVLFRFPLTLRFKTSSGVKDETITVSQKQEDFQFPLTEAPKVVRIDPELTLLAKIHFTPTRAMYLAQLADSKDVVGRLLAIEYFSGQSDHEAIEQLKSTLTHDPFYGVRIEAAKGLRSRHNDEAFNALVDSQDQSDPRVRIQVVEAIGSFYSEKARDIALDTLDHSKNTMIQASALRSLGAYSSPQIHDAILKSLHSTTYKNELANMSFEAMRLQDDPVWIAPLMETLSQNERDFTRGGFSSGLETLAYLARKEENKDAVREFLTARLTHKKKSIQHAAISALGTLGDPRAIAAVEKFTGTDTDNPERSLAERTIATLRSERKPVDDFKNLRQEVLDLQKANRDMRKELDALKKKVETAKPADASDKKSKNKPAKTVR